MRAATAGDGVRDIEWAVAVVIFHLHQQDVLAYMSRGTPPLRAGLAWVA